MTEALSVSVNPSRLAVDPGDATEITLQIQNRSAVVELYSVEVLGDASAWITLDRARVPSFPNTTETVRASIRPPRESWPHAGSAPVGFRICSSSDPDLAVVEECQIDLKPFVEIDGEIKPTTAKGRFSASHRLRVINRGNAAVRVSIRAKVQQGDCDVTVPAAPIVIPAGERSTTRIKVRPSSVHLRGAEEMHSYRLNLQPEGGAPVAIDAMMRQRPIARVPTALLVAVALLLGGAYVAYGKSPNPFQQILQFARTQTANNAGGQTPLPAGTAAPTAVSTQSSQSSQSPLTSSTQGQPSPSITPTATCTVGAPTGVTAAGGNTQATINWVAPAPTCVVTAYTVTGSPGNITVSAGASAVSVLVPNLTNGTQYTFVVTARGAGGPGAGSAPSNPVTPVGPPSQPLNVTAIAGDASARVSWQSPSSNGGAPITGYVVHSSPAAGSASVTFNSNGGSAAVTELNNGTSYSFTVQAVNSAGAGPGGVSFSAVTPRCTGLASVTLHATGSQLTWSAVGTCRPYTGTLHADFFTIFGTLPLNLSFSADGINPTGTIPYSAPFGTNSASFTLTLRDSQGNTVAAGAHYP